MTTNERRNLGKAESKNQLKVNLEDTNEIGYDM